MFHRLPTVAFAASALIACGSSGGDDLLLPGSSVSAGAGGWAERSPEDGDASLSTAGAGPDSGVQAAGGSAGSGEAPGPSDAGAPAPEAAPAAPPPLPTGTEGFPTNDALCPPELPVGGAECGGGLGCQYPGSVCSCGFDSQWLCLPQDNQCLDPGHCALGFCHPAHRVCTECIETAHCADPARPYCRGDGFCVECLSSVHCSGPTPHCGFIPLGPTENRCVECIQDTDCPDEIACQTFFGVCG